MPNKIKFDISTKIPGGRLSFREQAIVAIVEELKRQGKIRKLCANQILNKYALLIQRSARKNLNQDPRRIDEGILRASIQTFITSLMLARLGALVYTDNEYSYYVHFGTGIYGEAPEGGHRQTPWIYFDEKRKQFVLTQGMEANRFLQDAFEEHHINFLMELERCLAKP